MTMPTNNQTVITPYQFKYSEEIKTIADCLPENLSNTLDCGFRFSFSDINNPNNYLPVALINPTRVLSNDSGQPITSCCIAYGLSMYTTKDALEAKAKIAIKSTPKFLKRVGNFYAKLSFTDKCGKHTNPNTDGHFTFFENSSFVGKNAVISHGALCL